MIGKFFLENPILYCYSTTATRDWRFGLQDIVVSVFLDEEDEVVLLGGLLDSFELILRGIDLLRDIPPRGGVVSMDIDRCEAPFRRESSGRCFLSLSELEPLVFVRCSPVVLCLLAVSFEMRVARPHNFACRFD
jgi:hypothetical protein